jgi:hypothetical protein
MMSDTNRISSQKHPQFSIDGKIRRCSFLTFGSSTRRAMTGVRYLRCNGWRFELLYYLLGSRDTSAGSFKQTDNIINLQIKRYLNSN